jgi:rare lipoprotein A (peptidoglycan hydrolase)
MATALGTSRGRLGWLLEKQNHVVNRAVRLRPERRQAQVLLGILGAALALSGCGGPDFSTSPSGRTLAPVGATSKPYRINNSFYRDRLYTPQPHYELVETGHASYYGDGDGEHMGPTAIGGIYDKHRLTAAHRTLPLPCVIEVENLENRRRVRLVVNDRGPFAKERILDVSVAAAKALGFYGKGYARVRLCTLVPESLAVAEAFHGVQGGRARPQAECRIMTAQMDRRTIDFEPLDQRSNDGTRASGTMVSAVRNSLGRRRMQSQMALASLQPDTMWAYAKASNHLNNQANNQPNNQPNNHLNGQPRAGNGSAALPVWRGDADQLPDGSQPLVDVIRSARNSRLSQSGGSNQRVPAGSVPRQRMRSGLIKNVLDETLDQEEG